MPVTKRWIKRWIKKKKSTCNFIDGSYLKAADAAFFWWNFHLLQPMTPDRC